MSKHIVTNFRMTGEATQHAVTQGMVGKVDVADGRIAQVSGRGIRAAEFDAFTLHQTSAR